MVTLFLSGTVCDEPVCAEALDCMCPTWFCLTEQAASGGTGADQQRTGVPGGPYIPHRCTHGSTVAYVSPSTDAHATVAATVAGETGPVSPSTDACPSCQR